MIEIAGKPVYDENGLMKSGVIIRHMVLPSHRKDSEKILRTIAEMYPKDSYLLSLMSQYTPFYKSCEHKEINRRISTYEYERWLRWRQSWDLTDLCRNVPLPRRNTLPILTCREFDLEVTNWR